MASLTSPRIPTLDFSNDALSNPGSSSWASMVKAVRKALEEFGSFEAYCDHVPSETHARMLGAIQDVFDLPVETKEKNVDESVPLFGYAGPTQYYPLAQATGFSRASDIKSVERFANLMWPQGNSSFCETMYSYIQLLMKFEQMVRKMVFESYGLDKYVDSSIESTDYLFRVYTYVPKDNETNGLEPHTDKTFLTILHQNSVNGLQVQSREGEWVDINPSPKSFTVMAGDSFMAWSNGRLHSPYHRVTITGNATRYSLGLFSFSEGNVVAPEEMVDEEHPLLFKSFHHLDVLNHSYSDIVKRSINNSCAV